MRKLHCTQGVCGSKRTNHIVQIIPTSPEIGHNDDDDDDDDDDNDDDDDSRDDDAFKRSATTR